MDEPILDQIELSDLDVMQSEGGNVLRAIRSSDAYFKGFGEAYFSLVDQHKIKAWKLHTRMTMNLFVPVGSVLFVFFGAGKYREIVIGEENYKRITVPPTIWYGFQGLAQKNLILNVADLIHEPDEVERMQVDAFSYTWRTL